MANLTVGKAADLGLDDDEGKAPWVVICELHKTILNTRTREAARSSIGTDFCDRCRYEDDFA